MVNVNCMEQSISEWSEDFDLFLNMNIKRTLETRASVYMKFSDYKSILNKDTSCTILLHL